MAYTCGFPENYKQKNGINMGFVGNHFWQMEKLWEVAVEYNVLDNKYS